MDARLQRLQALVTSNRKGANDAAARLDDCAGNRHQSIRRGRERIRPQIISRAERRESEGERSKVSDNRPSTSTSAAATPTAQTDVETRQKMKELALERHKQREVGEGRRYRETGERSGLAQPETRPTSVMEEKRREEGERIGGDDNNNGVDDDKDNGEIIPLLRPVFVPKTHRHEGTPASAKDEQEEKEREAQRLLIEYVRREYEASLPQESSNGTANDPLSVDDTDPTDDIGREVELQAWRLRELLRIKRDRAARDHWEREQIELERIRNMTEEERRRLDEAKMREWQERPQSQMRFMQKYYHKGAFFMNEDEPLYQRDYAQATGEDAHANREMLPEVKQVRDFGKKGRTKWTHLVGEDTTAFDYGWGRRKNEANYKLISRMGGMRGHLDNPSKRQKNG